jgi:hypothetical protein
MHPEFATLLSHICDNSKIGAVRVITNGTLIPNRKTINALNNPKVFVKVSNYREHSNKLDELEAALSENNINYRVMQLDHWFDYGDLETRNRTSEELSEVFSDCRTPTCQSYLNGEFHFCPRSSAGVDLGLVPRIESDYVDIGKLDSNEARKQMKRFLSKTKRVKACDYCDNSSYLPLVKIEPGLQW